MNHAPLVDTTVTPDAMSPTKGDLFQRPTPMGWERIVIINVVAAHVRTTLHDISAYVREPGHVSYISGEGSPRTVDPEHFRAILVALDMKPLGRMRTAPEAK